MDLFSGIFIVLGELAYLAHMLFTNSLHFVALCTRSRSALAAENLFLRKQLACFQELKVVPRRFDNVSRFVLVLLWYGFAWKDALVNVTPKTFIGWHRARFRLFWRWKSRQGRLPIAPELRVLKSPYQCPLANCYCERFVGTLRRECLIFLIPLDERHLLHILKEWTTYYNRSRPHLLLGPGIPSIFRPNYDRHVIRSMKTCG